VDESTNPAQAPTTKRKVLCIEDEHFIGELYARALMKAGYDTRVVIDGLEGLKQAQTNQYDIILLDLMIPSMTGMEILKQLRDPSQATLKAKIIITTNLEQKEETRTAIEQQADGYLIKAEITPKQLVSILDSIS
jgi:CheY-like chemotaxis protein